VKVAFFRYPSLQPCVLLHYDCLKHCTYPLNEFISAFNVVNLFLKHIVLKYALEREGAGANAGTILPILKFSAR
jgi:hypothetical protein